MGKDDRGEEQIRGFFRWRRLNIARIAQGLVQYAPEKQSTDSFDLKKYASSCLDMSSVAGVFGVVLFEQKN